MKPKRPLPWLTSFAPIVLTLCASQFSLGANKFFDLTPATAQLDAGAADWDTGTTEVWKTTAGGTTGTTWADGDDAFFQTGGANTISLSGTVIANSVTQTTTGTATTISGGTSLQINANTGIVNSGNSALTINSNITLNSSNVIFNTGNAINIGGVIGETGGARGINKLGGNTLALSNANTYTGATSLGSANLFASGGTLTVNGASGSLASSSGYIINGSGSQLLLDYSAGAATDRLNDSGAATLNFGGELRFTNSTNAQNSSESFGTLTLGTGAGIVSVNQGGTGGAVNTITAGGFARGANSATGLIRGSNLGLQNNTNRGEFKLADTTGLIRIGSSTSSAGNNSGSDKTLAIVPYLIGDTSAANNGSNFTTYDTTSGFRVLGANEQTTLAADYTTPGTVENVNAFNGTITSGSATTVNSLRFNAATQALNGSGGALVVESGAILATANNGSIGNGFGGVTLGNGTWNEGVVTTTPNNTLAINAPVSVTGGGGLTKTGTGTLSLTGVSAYTGPTTINQGTLSIDGAGQLNSGSYAANISSYGPANFSYQSSADQTLSGVLALGTGGAGSFLKTNTGTLTLSGGGSLGTGNITAFGGSNAAVLFGGMTKIASGGYTSAGEFVVGGFQTGGGAGVNTNLTMDGGSLAIASWLSLGRGNGIGAVSSDIVLNNNASVTADNFSAGFNGGNAANQPKGTFTLNNSSAFTIATGGRFLVAESSGSNMTLTLNHSSSVTLLGDSGVPDRRMIGGPNGTGVVTLNGTSTFTDNGAANSFNVGYQNGNGTLNVNTGSTFATNAEIRVAASNGNGTFAGSGTINVQGGTLSANALTLARNNNDAASTFNAQVNVTAGTVNIRSGQSLIGWRGTSSTGTLSVSGGSFNQGTVSTANMSIGSFAGTTGAVNVSGTGALNLQNNSSLRFSDTANANAVRTLTISGGTLTFYSDGGGTVGGTGTIDLMVTSNPTGTSTIHLNGGTLTANQIKATSATGTRVVNFNGGTLKSGAGALAATFLANNVATRANVRNGGAIIDTNGNNLTIGQALLHSDIGGDNATDGGLTKNGAGTLALTGANDYTGDTIVNAGVLAVNGSSIADSGKLVINGGQVDPSGATEVVDKLFFGGVQQAAGTWGAAGSGATNEDSRFTGTGVISVTTGPGTGNTYSDWASANAPGQTKDQDHDNDGVENGIEYFMGLSGSAFTANPAPISGLVTWPMGATYTGAYGTDYEVQTSTDLVIWTKVDEGSGDNTVTVNPGTSVVYDMTTGGKRFVRLVVNN